MWVEVHKNSFNKTKYWEDKESEYFKIEEEGGKKVIGYLEEIHRRNIRLEGDWSYIPDMERVSIWQETV